jgi:hypothetical protein
MANARVVSYSTARMDAKNSHHTHHGKQVVAKGLISCVFCKNNGLRMVSNRENYALIAYIS